MNLSSAPTKTPIADENGSMPHVWQRWFSDLYAFLVALEAKEKAIDAALTKKSTN